MSAYLVVALLVAGAVVGFAIWYAVIIIEALFGPHGGN